MANRVSRSEKPAPGAWRGVAARDRARPARGPVCPQCGGGMVLREGRSGQFWGCRGFPECRGTVDPRRASSAAPGSPAAFPAPSVNPSRAAILGQLRACLDALEAAEVDSAIAAAAAAYDGLEERWSGRWRPAGR
jgi:ssDNA-binding Zn-finger/Zn-ribbon topoisomerase 1